MDPSSVALLASGNSLGAYIPAMHLHTFLKGNGIETEIHVLENLYHAEIRDKIRITKKAFHSDFNIARMGHKLAKPIDSSLEEEAVQTLLKRWKEANITCFAVFTGFWIPILMRYEKVADNPVDIQLIRMDAIDTPSFKVHKQLYPRFNNVWFYDPSKLSPYSYLNSNEEEPLPYHRRYGRILIHGGGWGIGTYKDTVSELREIGYALDVIVYDSSEVEENDGITRYYGTKDSWDPWSRDEQGQHTFPPMIHYVHEDGILHEYPLQDYFEYIQLMRNYAAIISKPGGSTLNDALAFGIPFIMLEPFGDHELHNSAYWESCGFGIQFTEWKNQGYSKQLLMDICRRLLEQRSTINHFGRITYAAENNSYV